MTPVCEKRKALYKNNGENALLGAGISSLTQHLSCTPNLKRLWLNNVTMTPQMVNYLTVVIKETKITEKNRQETREKSKSMMTMKLCFQCFIQNLASIANSVVFTLSSDVFQQVCVTTSL